MLGIGQFLSARFAEMPMPIRVLTYLALLALFGYLMLLPRFVDGQIVTPEATTDGVMPYRGADLQLLVDGRPYKFRGSDPAEPSTERATDFCQMTQ